MGMAVNNVLDILISWSLSQNRLIATVVGFILGIFFSLPIALSGLFIINLMNKTTIQDIVVEAIGGAMIWSIGPAIIAFIAYGPIVIWRPISERPDVVSESSCEFVIRRYK